MPFHNSNIGERWLVPLGVVLLFVVAQSHGAVVGPVIDTGAGSIQGTRQGAADVFLGIPYAEPPVGERRWRPPVTARPWHGVRDGTHFASSCYQAPATPFGPFTPEFMTVGRVSEDCLYLNVWTPTKRVGALPVMVWIHGGGFGGGSGSVPIYNGAYLAAKGAVVVTINYRVGAFGFLAHPSLSRESASGVSGNYGLLDMIAALVWVRDHIGAFGGDPAKVTIAGQSAGAIAVNDLMVSPLATTLFSRAIAESGSGMGVKAVSLAEAETNGEVFAREAGATSAAALRALGAERVLTLSHAGPPVPGEKPRKLIYVPTLDQHVLLAEPDKPSTRPLSQAPLLTGFNADEGEIFGRQALTPAAFEDKVRDRYGEAAAGFLAAYPHGTPEEASTSATLMARDRYMASLILWAEARTRDSSSSIYAYLYEHPFPGPGREQFGTFHTSEVPYVFGVLDQGGRPFGADDRKVSEQLSSYWLNFLRAGDPNGPGLVHWPRSSPAEPIVMGLGDRLRPRPAVSTPARLALFRAYVAGGGQLSLF
jgi:para-nitrobenzyl esterase